MILSGGSYLWLDRFGIQPLYYTVSNGQLLIARETKAFLPFDWKAE
jgi:asparagine synthetase B (glutamine-hydrolysing)